ncbi:alpha/beta hydrolase [Minwuia thermotolerans]|uniref:Alpha/beta hydrolase n=2 Tax=Minwuia thermotolerans TaxID=2056226 RepID=A0A2M9G2H3_9PROT|nr:alpha/beta hydrolase [Minwuia thermotolerans]
MAAARENGRQGRFCMTDVPSDLLKVRAPAPDWYHANMADAGEERFVDVDGCAVHYLSWPAKRKPARGGLLFVHGGGGHAHWWSFIAPFLAQTHDVASISLSGMGDSGARDSYGADVRVADMRGVIADAGLAGPVVVVGASFGGFMASRFGQTHGDELAGIIVCDSPLRPPERREEDLNRRPRMGNKRHYESFEEALSRFRLAPAQPCDNEFLVEHIGRHSIKREPEGWCWKWHGGAMDNSRFGEPFDDFLAEATCRKAYLYGEKSAIVDEQSRDYIRGLIGEDAPMVGIPEAHHHLALDQPLAFVVAVRSLLAGWRLS